MQVFATLTLTKSAVGGPGMPVPPISFPPFGNPPFLIPPPNSNPPKGGKPQGALARRPLWRGWGNRGAPFPAEPRAAALRVPGPLHRLDPLAPRPPRAGRAGRGGEGSFLTPPAPRHGVRCAHPSGEHPPCALCPPEGGGALVCWAAGLRARGATANSGGGTPPLPPTHARRPTAGRHGHGGPPRSTARFAACARRRAHWARHWKAACSSAALPSPLTADAAAGHCHGPALIPPANLSPANPRPLPRKGVAPVQAVRPEALRLPTAARTPVIALPLLVLSPPKGSAVPPQGARRCRSFQPPLLAAGAVSASSAPHSPR